MAYADQLARVGIVKINLARNFITAKERGFIEVPAERYLIEAVEVSKSILAEYDRTHDADLLGLVADLMRAQSDAMHELTRLPKARGAPATEGGWHNFLELPEKMPASDIKAEGMKRQRVTMPAKQCPDVQGEI